MRPFGPHASAGRTARLLVVGRKTDRGGQLLGRWPNPTKDQRAREEKIPGPARGEQMACPAVWLQVHLTIQCAECGSVLQVEAVNPTPDDLDGTPEIECECPTCSRAPGVVYHRIPVVLLVGDQVEASTVEDDDQTDGETPSEVREDGTI